MYLKLPISSTNPFATFKSWAGEIRKTNFATIGNPWIDYTPVVTASGSMTISSLVFEKAAYRVREGTNEVEIWVYATFTTGGVASTDIYVTVPFQPSVLSMKAFEPLGCEFVIDATTLKGLAFVFPTGRVCVRRYDTGNWALSTGRAINFRGSYTRE